MLNKDKRSIVLSMVLGDGCLSLHSQTRQGTFTADHGLKQADYISWKAKILSEIFERDVKVRTGHRGNSIQISVYDRRMTAWRKFCYPNGKKTITRILPYIRHPEMAFAIWLMDDGYCEPSISKLADGTKKNYGARLRIFTESQPIQDHYMFIKWFEENLGVKPKLHLYYCSKRKQKFPFLKLNQVDSLKIWEKIREFVLQFKSMQYKFRYLEELYQKKLLQCIPSEN